MSSLTKQGKKLSAIARLQREINSGRAPEEAYIPPENIVDADTRTLQEKARLLNWADAYEPIPWQQKPEYVPSSRQEGKLDHNEVGSSKSLAPDEALPKRQITPATEPFVDNELSTTPGISKSLGKFRLESEPSVSPKKPKPLSKASRLASNELTFHFLGDNERLKAIPHSSVPSPPSMTYQRRDELEQLVHDWEFGETLVINECFIPLQYWQAIYREHFPVIWNAIKVIWGQWRFIFGSFVACERDWNKFWVRYGKWTSITKLLLAMRQDRGTLDQEDTSTARQEIDFTTFYLTRNEGSTQRKVMSRDTDIARRWRERHSLEARWWHSLK